jgi:hypothetical protein
MKKVFFTITLLFCCLFGKTFAQDVQFTAKPNKPKVVLNEIFSITYSINQAGAEFTAPDFGPFRSVSPPQQGHSRYNINGAVSESYTITFNLQPTKEGTFTIKPAIIKLNGRNYQSNEVKMDVVKSAQPEAEDYSKSIFLKTIVNKNKAYVGEQLSVVFKLYHRVNLVKLDADKFPDLNGFWSEVIDKSNTATQMPIEVIDGLQYNVAEVHKMLLIPQRAGTLEITPLSLKATIRNIQKRGNQSIFDFFGHTTYEDINYVFASKPYKIEVMSLPNQGKPKDFGGAVGEFSIEANLDKTSVKAHEAINLKFTITGKGNLPLIENPKPTFPVDMEVYDPKLTDKTTTSPTGVSGSRSFEYLIIPRHAGNFTIEPVTFSYFDPVSKTYKTLASGAFDIEVAKNDQQENVVMASGRRQEEIKLLGSDIRFIHLSTNFVSKTESFFGSILFYLLMLLPFILFGGFLMYHKKQEALNSNPLLVKSRNANKKAVKSLSIAKTNLEANNLKVFYEEVYKAIYGYIADKMQLPVAGLDKDKISAHLTERGVATETIQKLHNTINLCEMARFAPITEIPAAQVYNDAVFIISKIEEEIK